MRNLILVAALSLLGVSAASAQATSVPEQIPVFVLGQVQRPGVYPQSSGETVLSAIAKAGGVNGTPQTVTIRRKIEGTDRTAEIILSMADLQSGKASDAALKPYDVISVRPAESQPAR